MFGQMRQACTCTIGVLLAGLCVEAHAAYSCTASVTPISVVYSPTVPTENISTGTYTVSCTRLISDPATLTFNLRANNGLQPTGATNRVQLGATANRYSYELYRLTPYINANRWQNTAALQFLGTIAFGAGLSGTATGVFDLRLAGGQPVRPAGTYTDTVTVTLRNNTGGAILNTTSFGVTVVTTNSCQITTSPGNMNFTYTSFQAGVATANTSYEVRCTTGLPYTMALDLTSSTLLGLTYTLALSAASGTGTGIEQLYNINGSIAAGQAGTCANASCAGSQTRTLTISY